MTLFLLQSKTPALVFEYINNTDFKVSLPECKGGRLPVSLKSAVILGCWKVLKSYGASLKFSQMSASPSFPCVKQKSVNRF